MTYVDIRIDFDDNKQWGGGFRIPKDNDKREKIYTDIRDLIRYLVKKFDK